jgi:hypothetical protein
VPVCGNNVPEGDEECDIGSLNGAFGYCCDSTCHLAPVTTVCRQASLACEDQAKCDGASAFCPATNPKRAKGAICRPVPSGAECDVVETCDGIDAGCPVNQFAPSEAECGPQPGGICEERGHCPGNGPLCGPRVKKTSECRAASGECDIAEFCDGTSVDCPQDAFALPNTACGGTAESCQTETSCTGNSKECPVSQPKPSGDPCVDPTCDPPDGTCEEGVCRSCAGDADVVGAPGRVDVRCTLDDISGGQKAFCTAEGYQTSAAAAEVLAADADGCVPGCPSFSGKRVTRSAKARFSAGQSTVQTRAATNKNGKRYLKEHSNIEMGVCLSVTDREGRVRRKQCPALVTKPIRKPRR